MYRMVLSYIVCCLLIGCTSTTRSIGTIGPKKLSVYAIADNDFLSASRMLIVLDQKGQVVAFTGGTVSGPGTIGLQAAGTAASATAVVMGGKSIQKGLQNIGVHGKISTDSTVRVPALDKIIP